MIFYDFLYKYADDDYKHLPGLIQCHLKKLTKWQLEILWRYYFAKESHEAIGKALNCAARTIGYQRVQARFVRRFRALCQIRFIRR